MLAEGATKGPKRSCHVTYTQLWAAPKVGHATAKQQVSTVIAGLKARAACFMLVMIRETIESISQGKFTECPLLDRKPDTRRLIRTQSAACVQIMKTAVVGVLLCRRNSQTEIQHSGALPC
jgi:hypothetical protein